MSEVIAQFLVIATLLVMLTLFFIERWRYDFVSLGGVLFLTASGVIDPSRAFDGFSHPAVVTVAAVLVIGEGLKRLGLVTRIATLLSRVGSKLYVQLLSLSLSVALLSSVMNNIGALIVFMPVAIEMARSNHRPSSLYLMPLAFSALLGGMLTLIGTPPNIIISSFRQGVTGHAFSMFDFTPVGAVLVVTGTLFMGLIGWRFLPKNGRGLNLQDIEKYLTEISPAASSRLIGKQLYEVEKLSQDQVEIIALKRGQTWHSKVSLLEVIQEEDVLVVEADKRWLQTWVQLGLVSIVDDLEFPTDALRAQRVEVVESVVMPGSMMAGQRISDLHLRYRFGVSILAVGRQEQSYRGNLKDLKCQIGDSILMRGPSNLLAEALSSLSCLPIEEKRWHLVAPGALLSALGLFTAGIITASISLLPMHIALSLCALGFIAAGWVPAKKIYESIPWPVITLLAAMIPIGQALQDVGAAQLIADKILALSRDLSPTWVLLICIGASMALTDLVNNAAAAILMAPIALQVAAGLSLRPDPFLMAVAIGASSSFLTPIGHQCNTLILGPGGYKFSDYWKLGLPLDLLIASVAAILIPRTWPF